MRGEDLRDRDFKLRHHLVADLFLRNSFGAGNGFAQASALVHSGGGYYSFAVRQSVEMGDFSGGKGHRHEAPGLLFEFFSIRKGAPIIGQTPASCSSGR